MRPRPAGRRRRGAGTALALFLLPCVPAAGAAQAPDPAGDWAGVLELPGARLRIVFHVAAGDSGWTATMDSPDQGARGIPTGSVTLDGSTLTITVPVAAGEFQGTLAGDTLRGEWRQGGQALPLVLHRGGGAEATPPPPARPQHPVPPLPYEAEEVRVPNAAAGVELAGTFTRPRGDEPVPAVLLITGSGPQTRDEDVAGHRIFAVLADALTRRGIAVLRVDDRGIGGSTGDFRAATSRDFASDAAAGVAFLRSRPGVRADAVGLVGHSEGGLVAPMVAAEAPVAFAVLLAGPAVDGEEILVSQTAAMQRAAGVPDAQIAANGQAIRAVAAILGNRPPEAWSEEVTAALLTAVPAGVPEEQARAAVEPQVAGFATPWMASFVAYDPRPALEALTIPVLALFGSLDVQVLPSVNLEPMRDALAGNPRATVEVLPGLNHLFQPAGTGLPDEYARIETTMDPAVLDRIADWIGGVTGGGGG